jgi:hypothetical protein
LCGVPTVQIFKRKEFAFGDEGPYKMTPAMKAVLNRVKDITLTADKMVRIPSALYFSNISLSLSLSLSLFLSLSLSLSLSLPFSLFLSRAGGLMHAIAWPFLCFHSESESL